MATQQSSTVRAKIKSATESNPKEDRISGMVQFVFPNFFPENWGNRFVYPGKRSQTEAGLFQEPGFKV